MKFEECMAINRTYVIAEMSGNHGGKLEKAMDIVHAAYEAGADCLKTQTYTADTLTLNCDREEFTVKGGLWNGRTLYDLYSEGYTPWAWQEKIKQECDRLGMDFMSTPFDFTAVDYLEKIGCQYYKIASPELVDIPLITYTARKGKPMFISTGMGNEEEITEAVEAARSCIGENFVLLKCCSQYPSAYENMDVASMDLLRQKFHCRVGLSDHSEGFLGAVVAVSMGGCVIEKHLCMSRDDGAVDCEFSMTPQEFKEMVDRIRDVELIRGKAVLEPSTGELRGLANRRSLYVTRPIRKGETFTSDNVRSVRPAKGLAPKYYYTILGKKAARDLAFGTPLAWEDVEGGRGQ